MTADISKIVTDDPMDTLPIQQFLTYRLSRVQAKLNAQAARMLRETSGVTLIQWRIIAIVGTSGQTRLSEIARATALDKGLLSRNLATLIKEQIIQATPDETDQRAQNLTLAPRGQDVFERTLPVTRRRQSKLRENLTPDELETFRRVLDKLEIAADLKDFT